MNQELDPNNNYLITTTPDEIKIGLFGGIILFIFEVLPYLHSKSIFPAWDIKSPNYGKKPHFTVIPGVLDLAYEPQLSSQKEINLSKLRKSHSSVLGNDWKYLNKLWNSYFKIPNRIASRADSVGDLSEMLGLHYRGTDKNLSSWDTNPVTQDEYITVIKNFIVNHTDILSIFIATDEYSFVEKFKTELPEMRIINLGEIESHLQPTESSLKADGALLDCLLLSRCKYLINTSSALSGFAKVLNPDLECYRMAASKLFSDIPYFPIAYIPKLTSDNFECQTILNELFRDDWLQNKKAHEKYKIPFATYKRNKKTIFQNKYFNLMLMLKSKISPARLLKIAKRSNF